jgi:hypothetical protein
MTIHSCKGIEGCSEVQCVSALLRRRDVCGSCSLFLNYIFLRMSIPEGGKDCAYELLVLLRKLIGTS